MPRAGPDPGQQERVFETGLFAPRRVVVNQDLEIEANLGMLLLGELAPQVLDDLGVGRGLLFGHVHREADDLLVETEVSEKGVGLGHEGRFGVDDLAGVGVAFFDPH